MPTSVSLLLQLLLCIGVPALIALFAPKRWRLGLFVLWVFAPLLIALALAAGEMATGKSSAADLDKLVYGLLLIGSILALPWLMACGLGYGIGTMLRGRKRPQAAEPVATEPPPPSAWQAVHVGFDHDELTLDGLPVWSLPWHEENGEPVMLAHPAHPQQLHAFEVYSVTDGTRTVRFAAAELSNSVWGFYR